MPRHDQIRLLSDLPVLRLQGKELNRISFFSFELAFREVTVTRRLVGLLSFRKVPRT
jgi:hypothetical protein